MAVLSPSSSVSTSTPSRWPRVRPVPGRATWTARCGRPVLGLISTTWPLSSSLTQVTPSATSTTVLAAPVPTTVPSSSAAATPTTPTSTAPRSHSSRGVRSNLPALHLIVVPPLRTAR